MCSGYFFVIDANLFKVSILHLEKLSNPLSTKTSFERLLIQDFLNILLVKMLIESLV